MKKHELLVPAGNMDCLYQAVYHGADAVYIAGQNFGARKFATNFTNDQLIEAIRFCHLYGVKVYVTMNTLVKDNEVSEYLNQIRFLHKNNVDAVIVQDFGMICLLREMFPNLEIHASTQANNSSVDICRFFYEIGVKRVVFSRELSVDEIDSIDVPIEKEAFIHGALCVSYSGCCLMSSMLGGRSGNRGECAGSCRMPYTLTHNGEIIRQNQYLLSMKELNTSSVFSRLLESSIFSFKIEGRMKGPLYVGFVTHLYRRLIDGENIDVDLEIEKLKTIFNREFTFGHMFNSNDMNIINYKSPNHVGLKIGKAVTSADKIKLILDKGMLLHQNDAIRFLNSNKGMIINYLYDDKMQLCNSSSGICYVDNKVGLNCNDILTKTQDSLLEKEYIVDSVVKRIAISFKVVAILGSNLKISVSDGIREISVEGPVVEKAINYPTTCSDIENHLCKIGNTPFIMEKIDFDISDNIFIQVKVLNDLRRYLIEELIDARKNYRNLEYIENNINFLKYNDNINVLNNKTCFVYYEEQLKTCLDLDFNRIYVSSYELYEKYKANSKIYYALERCIFDYSNLPLRSLSSDIFRFNDSVVGSYHLNVTNIYSAYYLRKLGLKVIPLSVELNDYEIDNLISSFKMMFGNVEFEILWYGRVENMIIKGNILGISESDREYALVDSKKRVFPVYYCNGKTHIYNCEYRLPLSINSIVTTRFDFIDEDSLKIKNIVKQYE